jgi:hypothetical protein
MGIAEAGVRSALPDKATAAIADLRAIVSSISLMRAERRSFPEVSAYDREAALHFCNLGEY